MLKVHYSESASVKLVAGVLKNELASVVEDLYYLASQEALIELISSEKIQSRNYVANDWISFSQHKNSYDQIRWLDLNGKERLRVNFNNGRPISVSENELQNKRDRYYFTETVKLNQNEAFISPLDLNIENKKIEQSLKPMVRVGTPIFDLKGNKQGIILINYSADELLLRVKSIFNGKNSYHWLLNSDGYWLKGSSNKQEWGFMLHNAEHSMANQYPNAWKLISAKGQGQFMDESGLWTYDTAYPLPNSLPSVMTMEKKPQYYWKVVCFIPKKQYFSTGWQTGIKLGVATLVILIGFFIIIRWEVTSWNEVRKVNKSLEEKVIERTSSLRKAKEQADALSMTDMLTGMNNRRAFFKYGNYIHEQAVRYEHCYCVMMLDLDFFKNVNDTYGHKIGDEALKASGKAITMVIRTSDVAARVGGEEFAVILPETSEEAAKDLAERLRLSIADIRIPLESGSLNFTVSIGISKKDKDDSSVDDVLVKADTALYQAKKQGRNRVEVLIKS